MPGTMGALLCVLVGVGRLMTRLQLGRGQAIRRLEARQISRQLHGQRTYFLPGGAVRTGWREGRRVDQMAAVQTHRWRKWTLADPQRHCDIAGIAVLGAECLSYRVGVYIVLTFIAK